MSASITTSVLKCGRGKVWLDSNESNEISMANSIFFRDPIPLCSPLDRPEIWFGGSRLIDLQFVRWRSSLEAWICSYWHRNSPLFLALGMTADSSRKNESIPLSLEERANLHQSRLRGKRIRGSEEPVDEEMADLFVLEGKQGNGIKDLIGE